MKQYEIKYKPSKHARRTLTLTRFADSLEAATASANKALDESYYGDAVLISVTEL